MAQHSLKASASYVLAQANQVILFTATTTLALLLYFRLIRNPRPGATSEELVTFNEANNSWLFGTCLLSIGFALLTCGLVLCQKYLERNEANAQKIYEIITAYLNQLPQVQAELALKERVILQLNRLFQIKNIQGLGTLFKGQSASIATTLPLPSKPWDIQNYTVSWQPITLKDALLLAIEVENQREIYEKIDKTLQAIPHALLYSVLLDTLKIKLQIKVETEYVKFSLNFLNVIHASTTFQTFITNIQKLPLAEGETEALLSWCLKTLIQVLENLDKLSLFLHFTLILNESKQLYKENLTYLLQEIETFEQSNPASFSKIIKKIRTVDEKEVIFYYKSRQLNKLFEQLKYSEQFLPSNEDFFKPEKGLTKSELLPTQNPNSFPQSRQQGLKHRQSGYSK